MSDEVLETHRVERQRLREEAWLYDAKAEADPDCFLVFKECGEQFFPGGYKDDIFAFEHCFYIERAMYALCLPPERRAAGVLALEAFLLGLTEGIFPGSNVTWADNLASTKPQSRAFSLAGRTGMVHAYCA